MAETFDWRPTVDSTSGTVATKVRSAQFGDGYQQRLADGLNNVQSTYTLQFRGDETKVWAIYDFLVARGGAESFWYTHYTSRPARLFYCETWSEPVSDGPAFTITATFVQTFSPGSADSTS